MMKTMTFDENVLQCMVTRTGFSNAYWDLVRQKTLNGDKFTNRELFEALNDARCRRFGEPAFPSYAAFHMWLKRRN